MDIEYLVGIDFGHGETTASCIEIKSGKLKHLRIRDNSEEDSYKIESVVYRGPTKDGSLKYSLSKGGDDFVTTPAICLSLKEKIRELRGISNKNQKEAFENFIRLVYQKLLENNTSILSKDGKNFLLFIASPTNWNSQDKADYKQFVEQAVGREIGWVINESDAAYYQKKQEGLVLVVDYGSSTIDFTLVYNNKKINIDNLSNQMGARAVELDMWSKYRFDPSDEVEPENRYANIIHITEDLKRKHQMNYLNIDDWMMFNLRKWKEDTYTKDGTLSYFAWNEPLIFRLFKLRGFPLCQQSYEDELSDNFLGSYIRAVSDMFVNVRSKINSNEDLREQGANPRYLTLIVSGGASRMPWVCKSLSEVFGIPYDTIKQNKDDRPEYIVSDGIVKYAYALYQVKVGIVDLVKEFKNWLYLFFHLGDDIKRLISKVCSDLYVKRVREDKKVKQYGCHSFQDSEIPNPKRIGETYFKSSILSFMSDIAADINNQLLNDKKAIQDEIFRGIKEVLHEQLNQRMEMLLTKSFGKRAFTWDFLDEKQINWPTIDKDFTIGDNKFEAVSDKCLRFMGQDTNTKYGYSVVPKSLVGGSYRKQRDLEKRKQIIEAYCAFIEQTYFKPYDDDQLERLFSEIDESVVSNIVKSVEKYLTFNPCGYDLEKEIKKELSLAQQKIVVKEMNHTPDISHAFEAYITSCEGKAVSVKVEVGQIRKGDWVEISSGKGEVMGACVVEAPNTSKWMRLVLDREISYIYKEGSIIKRKSK
ncbi:hypothetical protein [Parabacteroides sp.]